MASPFLHGVPWDGSPASAILWDAPTPRRPSRPVRYLHEPRPSCRPWFAPLGRGRPTGGQGVVGSGLPIRIDDGNVGVSQAGLTHHFFRAYAPLFPAFLRVFHGN